MQTDKVKIVWDTIHSKWQLVVYLSRKSPKYDTSLPSNQNKRNMVSKAAGQPEPKDGFVRLKEKATKMRLDGHITCALIYDNLDKNRTKLPILKIFANGDERWHIRASQILSEHGVYDFEL